MAPALGSPESNLLAQFHTPDPAPDSIVRGAAKSAIISQIAGVLSSLVRYCSAGLLIPSLPSPQNLPHHSPLIVSIQLPSTPRSPVISDHWSGSRDGRLTINKPDKADIRSPAPVHQWQLSPASWCRRPNYHETLFGLNINIAAAPPPAPPPCAGSWWPGVNTPH